MACINHHFNVRVDPPPPSLAKNPAHAPGIRIGAQRRSQVSLVEGADRIPGGGGE